MIGIIVWLILIFIIACCVCPGFLSMLAITLGGAILLFILFYAIAGAISRKDDEKITYDREKAIDEWERKWGRKHPTRK